MTPIAVIASLPDPANPTVIAIAATLGTFFGMAVAKLRGDRGDELRDAALEGAFRGTGAGLGVYLIGLIAELL